MGKDMKVVHNLLVISLYGFAIIGVFCTIALVAAALLATF